MFNTFKYDPETRQVQQLRSGFDPVTARSNQHQACNNCHAKKLRCSGEKSGCERCIASSLVCEYTRSNSRSSRRGGSASASASISGSSSVKKASSSDGTTAGDTSPSSGAQSRMLTPSPPLLAPSQETTTPRPQYGRPVSFAPGTTPQEAYAGAGTETGQQAFPASYSQYGSTGDMSAMAAAYGAGHAAGYTASQAEMWQSNTAMASFIADPAFPGASGAGTFTNPEEFFAMYPDLTQFPPDQYPDQYPDQNPDGQYWPGQQ